MLWRWIESDAGNRHSVALTRQTTPLPESLISAVQVSGGSVLFANRRIGGMLSWARALQPAFAGADLIVLHTHNQDIIPLLALAGMADRPPALLLNHADHIFWVGAGLVDAVVSTRRSGHALCAARRGIPAERNFLLPLCLQDVPRSASRADAKQSIGLPEDSVVLLTIARAVKFRSLGGCSFADALVPVLRGDPRRHLVVVGPRGTVDWSAAETEVPSQITVLAERADTQAFYDAADIYVDSFPFPSITSLLEAGLHGIPIVTRYPYRPGSEVMGADSVGMDDVLIRETTAKGFQATLLSLATDGRRRTELGEHTRASIEARNTGRGWRQDLAALYAAVLKLPRRSPPEPLDGPPQFEELDTLSPFVFGMNLERPSPRGVSRWLESSASRPCRRSAGSPCGVAWPCGATSLSVRRTWLGPTWCPTG